MSSVTLNRQIIAILANQGALTSDQLLSQLLSAFPDAGWTAELLSAYLVAGVRKGRFCIVGANGDQYQIRADMVKVYPLNWVYQDLCTCIDKRVSSVQQATSVHNAPFNGGETGLATCSAPATAST